jgi:sulfocyanin
MTVVTRETMSLSTPRLYDRRAFIGVASFAAYALLTGGRGDHGFMRYDRSARRVDLLLIAAFDESNSGYNFNGGSHGAHRITVPAGWHVRVRLINRDVIPHSVAVVHEREVVPMRIARPAIAGAASRALERGLPTGARQDDIMFVATPPGEYLIACAVPGQAALGSYLRLTVSSGAALPAYEVTPPPRLAWKDDDAGAGVAALLGTTAADGTMGESGEKDRARCSGIRWVPRNVSLMNRHRARESVAHDSR